MLEIILIKMRKAHPTLLQILSPYNSRLEMRFSRDCRGILYIWAGCGHLAEGSLAEQECQQPIVTAPLGVQIQAEGAIGSTQKSCNTIL
ncbi:hypothetical protein [Psychrobacter sp. CAL346-MNA-CIBAN-0220]|uniref:hypothetical protein n=1 Tax=Psychrobacter sp. CAL346-MNA-CIBAN-0220 TaxID=3140457 RepID=UPI00331DB669